MPSSAPPPGYIALSGVSTELWSGQANTKANEMLAQADNCCPDLFNLYIYNDFYPYATKNIMEVALDKFAKKLKKNPTAKTTVQQLEAITLFFCAENAFLGSDEGDAITLLVSSYAAALHTLCTGLYTATPSLLTPAYIPNLENFLRTAITLLSELRDYDKAIETKTSLQVLMALQGLDFSPKEMLIVAPEDKDSNEKEGDDEPPKKKKKKQGDQKKKKEQSSSAKDTKIQKLAELDFTAAEKSLGHKSAQFSFPILWKKYKTEFFGLEELKGRGWDISKWPESVVQAEKTKWDDLLGSVGV